MEISVRAFEAWAQRELEIYDFSEDLLRQFLTAYRAKHSWATTNSKRCQLLALWQCAFDEEYLDRPPRRKRVPKAKEHNRIPEAWHPEEFARLLEAAKADSTPISGMSAGPWWESLLLVCYDTGERRGAVLRTTPADVDLDKGWILFQTRKDGQPRICPLHPDTISAVRRMWDPGRELVWPWHASREAFDKRFRKLCKKAKIAYGRARGGLMHKIRRTTGTLVEMHGGDGAKAIGNTRAVFLKHYRDPRFFGAGELNRLPRPKLG